jgi:hypothetical protein
MNGSREEADVLVGETFITITPYVHLFDADANGEYNLTVDGLVAVIEDARTKYPIDPNRIYVTGYSAVRPTRRCGRSGSDTPDRALVHSGACCRPSPPILRPP